jgi:transposase
MSRLKKRWGHDKYYYPRKQLIERLKEELGWSEARIRNQIEKERKFLIKYSLYY